MAVSSYPQVLRILRMEEDRDISIPIVDISDWIIKWKLSKSATLSVAELWKGIFSELGFAIITGHQIPHDLFVQIQEECKSFFELPVEAKMEFQNGSYGKAQGYTPVGEESVAGSNGSNVVTSAIIDEVAKSNDPSVKLSNSKFPDPLENLVFMGADLPFPIRSVKEYQAKMNELLSTLHRISSAALGLENLEYFNEFYFLPRPQDGGEAEGSGSNDTKNVLNGNAVKFSHYFGTSRFQNLTENGDTGENRSTIAAHLQFIADWSLVAADRSLCCVTNSDVWCAHRLPGLHHSSS